MNAAQKRGLTFAGAFALLSVLLWFVVEIWVSGSGNILVVSKDKFSSQDMVIRYVVTDNGDSYGVGISTIGSDDPTELWEKLQPGCQYHIRYVDQSRYPYPRARGMSGLSIAGATKLDCPGLPVEPARPAPSAQELLDKIMGGQKVPPP